MSALFIFDIGNLHNAPFAGSSSFYEFQWEPLAEIHFPRISQIECSRINAEKIQTKKDTAEAPSVRALLHLTFYIGNLAFGIWHAFTISRASTLTITNMPPRWGWWCRGWLFGY
ncbi:MAG TPA: hypothetical protein DDZ56_07730 [Cytophagales bacterium]|nr:hypothetical protein [Cytophagales bacterium]